MDHFHRASQRAVLQYEGGRLGISAVPGAGKTHILSALAAKLIQDRRLTAGQEVLVVTLTNSSVDNFKARIRQFFDQPIVGLYRFRVRTLHGLAHDIVREKPGRVGLEERFGIVDERESALIRAEAVRAWIASRPEALDVWMRDDLREHQMRTVRRKALPDLLESVALAFIRSAKDHRLTPEALGRLLSNAPEALTLAEMGLAIYTDYQRALAYRGAVDFDDLIGLSLDLLESDPEYLARLRARYPYVLEDEAQDSSVSQGAILRMLSGPGGNWVRVGDANQAIYESFTTASPELLRAFVRENSSLELPESGRSQPGIIALANHLIDWAMGEHPVEEARAALALPHIRPADPGDPQPNPPEKRSAIHLSQRKYAAAEEISAVVESISKWLPLNPEKTVAVLVPRNTRGSEVISALTSRNIEVLEFLASTSNTRQVVAALETALAYLGEPQSSRKLAAAYEAWQGCRVATGALTQGVESGREPEIDEAVSPPLANVAALLRKIPRLEEFFSPGPGSDWQQSLDKSTPERSRAELALFRTVAARWQAAAALPIDQLVLTLAADLFSRSSDLALAHKLALLLRQIGEDHRAWRLPELIAELALIAKNERRFLGFSSDEIGSAAEQQRGKVVVTTVHKAKGLEWDRVYLMSVNSYDFPSGAIDDTYFGEKWFVRGNLNLEAEALAQLAAVQSSGKLARYQQGAGTRQARQEYIRERLRLIYVGITRAREELIITWNSGRNGEVKPSLALEALNTWWQAALAEGEFP